MKKYYYKDLFHKWEYTLPDGYREAMRGKSIEEQLEYLRYTYFWDVAKKTEFGKPPHDEYFRLLKISKLGDDFLGAIVDDTDGTVIGIKVQCSGSQETCYINDSVCIYSASDNNGAGYKCCEEYIYLVAANKD
jgi:hypothetical protein